MEEAENMTLRAVGLKDIYKIEKDFWNQINNKQVVSVNLLTERMVHAECVDGKNILVIEVPRAERMLKPVYKGLNPKSGTYRRNGEGDYLCDSLKVPFVMKGMQRVDDTPLHKLLREAITNTCVHADFYGRRGLVIQKMPDKFVFANPGGLRLSCSEAIGGVSDPRNGVMLKLLSMIEYGERAGSGLSGIFHVWRQVYKCSPVLEEIGGVDRTILTLDTHGQQPDIDAMIKLYGSDGLSVKSDGFMEHGDGFVSKSDGAKQYVITNDSDDYSMLNESVYHYRTSVSQNRKTDFPELPLKERNLMNVLVRLGASQVSAIASEMGLGISQTKCYLQKLISKGYVCTQGTTRDRTYMYVKDVR